MDAEKIVCLGLFTRHSFCSWYWHNNKNIYYRECELFGCSAFETAKDLEIIGKTIIIGDKKDCTHNWEHWTTTANQMGLWLPPWAYKRKCHICGAEQKIELDGFKKI